MLRRHLQLITRILASLLVTGGPACQETAWFGDPFAEVLGRARAEQRKVALYFWAEGSTHCANLWGETLGDGPVADELAALVCYSADVTRAEPAKLLQSYYVQVLPSVVITDAGGHVEDVLVGYLPQAEFHSQLRRILAGIDTVGAHRTAAAAAPEDLDLRLQLALKLRQVGDLDAAAPLLRSIRESDPQGESLAGAELMLFDARAAATDAAQPGDPPDPKPVRRVLRKLRHPSVAAKAWAFIASSERQHGRHDAARDAWHAALQKLPESQRRATAIQATFELWTVREVVQGRRLRFLAEALEDYVKQEAELLAAEDVDATTRATASLTLRAHGQALAMTGRQADGLSSIDRALALDPANDELRELRRQISTDD